MVVLLVGVMPSFFTIDWVGAILLARVTLPHRQNESLGDWFGAASLTHAIADSYRYRESLRPRKGAEVSNSRE